jgi:tetratricopeptide (TPR) repeat protein
MTGKTRKQQIEELLQDDPNDPFLRYGLAMEYVSAGDDEEAVRCFRELFAVVPDYVPAYLQAGQALTRLDRVEEARDVFRRGITAARQKNDLHAQGEMQEMLANLG